MTPTTLYPFLVTVVSDYTGRASRLEVPAPDPETAAIVAERNGGTAVLVESTAYAAAHDELETADRDAASFMQRMRDVPLGEFGRAMRQQLSAA